MGALYQHVSKSPASIAMSGNDREAPDVETSPFASLKIWRDKIQADLSGEPDRGPEYKLRLLLEQGKGRSIIPSHTRSLIWHC